MNVFRDYDTQYASPMYDGKLGLNFYGSLNTEVSEEFKFILGMASNDVLVKSIHGQIWLGSSDEDILRPKFFDFHSS